MAVYSLGNVMGGLGQTLAIGRMAALKPALRSPVGLGSRRPSQGRPGDIGLRIGLDHSRFSGRTGGTRVTGYPRTESGATQAAAGPRALELLAYGLASAVYMAGYEHAGARRPRGFVPLLIESRPTSGGRARCGRPVCWLQLISVVNGRPADSTTGHRKLAGQQLLVVVSDLYF
jgi:hypothetical protein